MISAVKLRSHPAGHRRIAHRGVKIDEPVESARSSNPLIDGYAFRLTRCGPSTEALIGKNGCTENLEASGVGPGDYLFVPRDDFIRGDLCPRKTGIGGRRWSVWLTNIVGALEQNYCLNAGLT